MNSARSLIILELYLNVSVPKENPHEETLTVRVKLDGKFQREILQQIEKTLSELSGVHSVNLTSMRSHALIDVNSSQVRPDDLIAAIERIKGDSWQCTADFNHETAKIYHIEEKVGANVSWVRHPQLNMPYGLKPGSPHKKSGVK